MSSSENMFNKTANFLHTLYGNNSLPRNSIQNTVESLSYYIKDVYLPFLKTQLAEQLGNHDDEQLLANVFNIIDSNSTPFANFSTEHRRLKIFDKLELYTQPIEYLVGNHQLYDEDDNTITEKPETAQFLPLKETLSLMFNNETFFNDVKCYVTELLEEKTVVSNIIQADYWQKRRLSHESKYVLPLVVYHDDLDTGNTLGSHAGACAIGTAYAYIPCLPPQYASQLCHIHSALLFRSSARKTFGNMPVFRPLLEELNELCENGLDIEHDGKLETIFFELVLVTGDNLGLNAILGFVESFSATHCCRICKIDSVNMKITFREDQSLLRTKDNYISDVIAENPSATGVSEKCIFNCVKSFHVTENIVVDPMHDVAEGMCIFTMEAIMKHYSEKGILKLELLNRRIQQFDFSAVGETNPPPCLKSLSIRMSAAETLCFTRYFGIIFYDLIPEDEEHWTLYLTLRKIIDIIFCTRYLRHHINQLDDFIQEHNYLYAKLVGPLKPKLHFLVHYARVMRLFGPTIGYSTMRPESKHREIKRVTNNLAGSVNIVKSCAVNQKFQISDNVRNMPTEKVTFGTKASVITALGIPQQYLMSNPAMYKWVSINGTTYKLGTMLLLEVSDSELPKFGEIRAIFPSKNDIMFYMKLFHTISFFELAHAYRVVEKWDPCENYVISYDTLVNPFPCSFIKNKKGTIHFLMPKTLI